MEGGERGRVRKRGGCPPIRCRPQYDLHYCHGNHRMVLSRVMAYLSLRRALWSGKDQWGSQGGSDCNMAGRIVCVA